MGKFKPPRGKAKAPVAPNSGLPCLVILILIIVFTMLLVYIVIRGS
jgi:hypothetical protein